MATQKFWSAKPFFLKSLLIINICWTVFLTSRILPSCRLLYTVCEPWLCFSRPFPLLHPDFGSIPALVRACRSFIKTDNHNMICGQLVWVESCASSVGKFSHVFGRARNCQLCRFLCLKFANLASYLCYYSEFRLYFSLMLDSIMDAIWWLIFATTNVFESWKQVIVNRLSATETPLLLWKQYVFFDKQKTALRANLPAELLWRQLENKLTTYAISQDSTHDVIITRIVSHREDAPHLAHDVTEHAVKYRRQQMTSLWQNACAKNDDNVVVMSLEHSS